MRILAFDRIMQYVPLTAETLSN